MKKKIPVKTFYLLAVISIGLIGLAAGSTYAMFTASAKINNPISFTFNLAETSEVLETVTVSVAPGDTEYVELEVHNTVTKKLNYAAWYMSNSEEVEVLAEIAPGQAITNTVGTMEAASKSTSDLYVGTMGVYVTNNDTNVITVNLGISGSVGQVVLSDRMKIMQVGVMSMSTPYTDFIYYLGDENPTLTSIEYHESDGSTSNESASIPLEADEIILTQYIGSSPNVDVPDTYKVNGKEYKVTILSFNSSHGVFYNNTVIENVSLAKNIKAIDDDSNESFASMFSNCSNLVSVTSLPSSALSMVQTFNNCSRLTTVSELPSNVTNMTGTFRSCSSLENVPKLPIGVKNLSQTFADCSSLVNPPEIPDTVQMMTGTFNKCVKLKTAPKLPKSLGSGGSRNATTALSSTFLNCSSLTQPPAEIPEAVTAMTSTFKGCTNLETTPVISDNITSMSGTFNGCTNLKTAPVIPSNVTNMNSTFNDCTSLTGDVTIKSASVSNAGNIFTGTSKSITVYAPSGSTTYTTLSGLTTTNGMPSNVKLDTLKYHLIVNYKVGTKVTNLYDGLVGTSTFLFTTTFPEEFVSINDYYDNSYCENGAFVIISAIGNTPEVHIQGITSDETCYIIKN